MRGTIYVMENGVPLAKFVAYFDVDEVEDFKRNARAQYAPHDVEFGPIARPWRRWVAR